MALQNKRVVYDLLFQASAATLLEVACTPKHLGAALGFLSVLHTWGQTLLHHPHVHCVVPAGGLSPDRTRWVHARPSFFLPVKVLSRVFRGKVVAGLIEAFRAGTLTLPTDLQRLTDESAFRAWLRTLYRYDWIVYAKPPFGGPSHVLHYLARYTHRVNVSPSLSAELVVRTESTPLHRRSRRARAGPASSRVVRQLGDPVPLRPPGFDELSVDEKIDLPTLS